MSSYRLLIDGKLVDGVSTIPVVNPATEEVIGQCPRASLDQLNKAVAAAKAAFGTWSLRSLDERRAAALKIADIIDANADELARLLTSEQGKPLAEAKVEIAGAAGFARYFTTLDPSARTLEDSATRKATAHRRPLGVIAAIIPWNFLLLIATYKLCPAIVAGNTVVLKPAPTTPLATLRFVELIKDVLPPGVLNIITDENDLGASLTNHPDVRKVSFTGSTATGKKVMASSADTLKRITLELGGNDAGIVLDDADTKKAAPGVFASAFTNNGQVCIALKRLYVHESIYDEMCEELAKIAANTVVDDGMKQGAAIGPLQNKKQYEKLKAYLADARQNGTIIAGGETINRPGYFIQPTIVRDIKEGARVVDEEQFGPILPVIKYSDVEDAVKRANDSPYGLGASVWSSDVDRAIDVASRIEAGTVWINKHLDFAANVAFGGAKQSGVGAEFGEDALEEYTQLQIINS